MTRTEHLLACIAEECAEIQKEVCKCLRFGIDNVPPNDTTSNQVKIFEEFNDLVAVIDMLKTQVGRAAPLMDVKKIDLKKGKVEYYMEYSSAEGLLDEDEV